MVDQLSEAERAEALDALPDWDYDEGRDAISRSIVFTDFAEAFGFMTQVALIAERQTVGLVIGLPLNLDGSDSPRTQSTRCLL